MGEVYRAFDSRLERHVALKILLPEVARDSDRILRFEKEAKAASALSHPNILTVYDVGIYEETRYIATEIIDGQTLRQRMRGTPLNLTEAISIAARVASALGAAHSAGILHRDHRLARLRRRFGVPSTADLTALLARRGFGRADPRLPGHQRSS